MSLVVPLEAQGIPPEEDTMFVGIAARAAIIWSGILVLAIMNGLLREAVFFPMFGTTSAYVLSGLLLSFLIMVVSYWTLPWLNARGLNQLLAVGFGWLVLTLVFEFSFGLWQGQSWLALLETYTFEDGNIWPLVLLVTALAPYIAARIRGCV